MMNIIGYVYLIRGDDGLWLGDFPLPYPAGTLAKMSDGQMGEIISEGVYCHNRDYLLSEPMVRALCTALNISTEIFTIRTVYPVVDRDTIKEEENNV